MNFALPPESDWNYIAELTGDKSWSSDNMRRLFVDLENCAYAPEGTPGHGFDGFIGVRGLRFKLEANFLTFRRATETTSLTSLTVLALSRY